MEEQKINVEELMQGLIELRSVCSMGTKQANSMIVSLQQLIQQSQQPMPPQDVPQDVKKEELKVNKPIEDVREK
jgi:hypothetical protein